MAIFTLNSEDQVGPATGSKYFLHGKLKKEAWGRGMKQFITLGRKGLLPFVKTQSYCFPVSTPISVFLQSGDDVSRFLATLFLMMTDDWALLARLLPTLTINTVLNVRITTSNSTSHPAQETVRQLWDKFRGIWSVNKESYNKFSDDENFDKMFNKYFK